jgi:Ser/Thr protein kinase RdoA (MazF antagonist)
MSDAISKAHEIAALACTNWDRIVSTPELFMHRENSVFKVQTKYGPAALRVHRHGYHSKAAIQSEMQWMAYLASHGVLAPAPIPNKQRHLLSEVSYHNKTYIVDLLTWLDGEQLGNSTDPLVFTKQQLQQIFFNLGKTIARMHDLTDAWKTPDGFTRHAWDRDGFIGEQAFWGNFWEACDISASDRQLLVQAREKAGAELDALSKAGADYGLIHADFVRQNILVVGTDVSVIDFDDSGFGFRMYDFATALVKNREEPHYETIKASLFEGYRSSRVLSQLDANSLDLFLALRDFAYLGWMEARRAEPGVEERMPGIRAASIAAAQKFIASPSLNLS